MAQHKVACCTAVGAHSAQLYTKLGSTACHMPGHVMSDRLHATSGWHLTHSRTARSRAHSLTTRCSEVTRQASSDNPAHESPTSCRVALHLHVPQFRGKCDWVHTLQRHQAYRDANIRPISPKHTVAVNIGCVCITNALLRYTSPVRRSEPHARPSPVVAGCTAGNVAGKGYIATPPTD